MNSLKYFVLSSGVLMALTGSMIVLADEVEEPQILEEEKEEVSYVFEDVSETVSIEPEVIIADESIETVADKPNEEEVIDSIVVEESVTEDTANGPALRTPAGQWGEDENGTYYMVITGERLTDTVTDIEGYYYGFNPTGYLYKNQRFEWNTNWYQAKEDGKLCVHEWFVNDYGTEYYYGEQGKGLNGVNTVDGTDYYFENGWKSVNKAFDYNGDPYYADEDGYIMEMMPGWNNFTQSDGIVNTYLVMNGTYIRGGVYYYTGDSAYYYFNSNGTLSRNSSNYVYANPSYYTRSKKDGKLYVNEWYHEKDYGYSYYFGNAGRSYQGFTTLNGRNYYFGMDGLLYADRAETINGHVYIFYEDGSYTLASNGWNNSTSYRYYVSNGNLVTSNFMDDNGELRYLRPDGRELVYDVVYCGSYSDASYTPAYCAADHQGRIVKNDFMFGYYFGPDGRSLQNGFHTINGYKYYTERGQYLVDTIRNIDGVNYIFDITGAATVAKEGFTTNIHTYYVLNGELANGIYEYKGEDCYFIDGIMQTNRIIKISDTQSMVASASGALVKSGWYTIDYPREPLYIQGTVYADNEGMLMQGLQKIGNKTYIFGVDEYTPYILNKNSLFKYGGKWYYANSDGAATVQNVSNGWINKGGNDVFYVRNGELVTSEILTIGSDEYVIDATGKLVKNCFWHEYNPDYHIYRTDLDGKIIKNAWVSVNDGLNTDGQYYFDADGKGLDEWAAVNGHTYYFDNGRMLSAEIRQINGQLYRFDEAGYQYTTIVNDGVYTSGRSLQVVRNGVLVKNQLYPHEGLYYLIDGVGSSLRNPGIQIMDFVYNRMTPIYLYSAGENALSQYTIVSEDIFDFFLANDAVVREGLVQYMSNMYAVVRDEYPYAGYKTWKAKNVPVNIKGTYYWADENGVLQQVVNDSRHSLSLTGNIGVNFYYSFSDVVLGDEGAMVEFTIDDVTTSFLVKDSHKTRISGVYYSVFSEEVTSVQLATKIAAKVILSSGDVVYEEQYAAKDYAMSVISTSTYESDLFRLMKSLLIYGGYAQKAFNYNTDNLAYAELGNYDVSDVTAAMLEPYAMTTSGSAAGLNYQGSTLALESLTTINHIFTLSSGHTISEYTFKLGDTTLTPIKRGSKYYVVIPNIFSMDLDTSYTVTVGNYSITYSALSYAYKVLINSNTSPELKDLMRALYKYNQAANIYFE